MCRGREESNKRHFDLNKPVVMDEGEDVDITCRTIRCELCDSNASLYCQADDAFLCKKCDEWVHGANFLAHRHVRCMLCNRCQNLTQRYLVGRSHEILLSLIVMKWPETQSSNRHADYCGLNNDESGCTRSLKRPFELI